MGLSLKTEEADRLARELSRLTGETMTKAMRERLERLSLEKQRSAPLLYAGNDFGMTDINPALKAPSLRRTKR